MAGRPSSPISADVPPAHTALAEALRAMKAESGIQLRTLAELCAKSRATISRTLAGQTLPDRELVRNIVAACDGDWERTERLWHAAVAEADRGSALQHFARRMDWLEEQLRKQDARIEDLEQVIEHRDN